MTIEYGTVDQVHLCKNCQLVETGVEHVGVKEFQIEPCDACLAAYAAEEARNPSPEMTPRVAAALKEAVAELRKLAPEEWAAELDKIYDLCPCGDPSAIGTHGVADGDVHSAYYCRPCYNKRKD